MNEKQDVTRRESTGAQTRSEPETVLRPPVDIYEDDEGITLHADMPGVTREGLEIRVNNDTLLIEGDSPIELPQGMQPLYADVRSTRYRREFGLSGELDTDAIDASLKDGVLTLRIPKRAEVRPRKIEVRTG
jgi:HSP20 family protein